MKPHAWLAPLSPLYGAALRAKNAAYDRGLLSMQKLKHPVISVGNLATGGSGKTPLVIALARLLMENGISADVLSRGYGRSSDATLRVPDDDASDADIYGDEPLLIARATHAPVFVGRSRFAAGSLAEQAGLSPNHLHLLDDGFQHRLLARDLDIVVLHQSDLAARLLPAGHLREPLSALARAQVVVVREEDRDLVPQLTKYLHPAGQTWLVRRTLTCKFPAGQRAVAFCGIARPEEFFAGLRAIGVELGADVAFPDHHRYTDADLRRLLEKGQQVNASYLVTTEKDAARLGAPAIATLHENFPLSIAKLETTFLDPESVVSTARAVIARHLSQG